MNHIAVWCMDRILLILVLLTVIVWVLIFRTGVGLYNDVENERVMAQKCSTHSGAFVIKRDSKFICVREITEVKR